MPAFASGQLNSSMLQNRNRIEVRHGHPLNNPDRPEFSTSGTAARALFGHALKALTSDEPGVAQAYWNDLKIAAVRAARDISGEKQIHERGMVSIELAQGALTESINDLQLTGGANAANARRDLYAAIDERVPRATRENIIDHLTTRALAESVDGRDLPRAPTGDRGRMVEGITKSPAYETLRDSIRQIYDNTEATPFDEAVIDIDALEEDERDAALAANNLTRVKQTQDILRSFATNILLQDVDRTQTRSSGEQTLKATIFEMETLHEAMVMESVVNWTHDHVLEHGGRLPTTEQTQAAFNSMFEDLSKGTFVVHEEIHTFGNNSLVARLRRPEPREGYTAIDAALANAITTRVLQVDAHLQDIKKENARAGVQMTPVDMSAMAQQRNLTNKPPVDPAKANYSLALLGQITSSIRAVAGQSEETAKKYSGALTLLSNLRADPNRNEKWFLITRTPATQRSPVFGKGSSKFEHMNAAGIFPSRFFKDHEQIAGLVEGAHTSNKGIRNKSALVIPDIGTDAVTAAVDAARKAGMPVVTLSVDYSREKLRDLTTSENVTVKDLSYNILKENIGPDGKTQVEKIPLFSSAGYSATNGALILLDGRGQSDAQSKAIQLNAFADMTNRVIVAGLGPLQSNRTDYASARAYRQAATQNTLVAVLDDNGKEIPKSVAEKATAQSTKTPLEMAKSHLEGIFTADIRALPVSSAAARLLVHEMSISGRTSEQVASLAKINATIGDLVDLPKVVNDGGKSLPPAEREKAMALAAAVSVDAFRQNDLKSVRRITDAATRAFDAIQNLKEQEIFNLSFTDKLAKGNPLVSAGQGKLPDPDKDVLLVGGKATPHADQMHIIDSTVKALADAGRTIVTTAEPGFNVAVMDAALRHSAPIVVVTPQDISQATNMKPEVAQRVLDIALNHPHGVAVGAYTTATPTLPDNPSEAAIAARDRRANIQPSYDARERKTLDLAASMTSSAILGFATTKEYVSYAVAKTGAERPVAALPGSYRDTANNLLTRDFASLAISFDNYGTSVTSSFQATENTGERQKTERDKDSGLVLGGHRATRIATWDYGADSLGEKETVGEFITRFTKEVESGKAIPMVNQNWNEQDRLTAMGVLQPVRQGIETEVVGQENSMWDQMVNLASHFNAETARLAVSNTQAMAGLKSRDVGMAM